MTFLLQNLIVYVFSIFLAKKLLMTTSWVFCLNWKIVHSSFFEGLSLLSCTWYDSSSAICHLYKLLTYCHSAKVHEHWHLISVRHRILASWTFAQGWKPKGEGLPASPSVSQWLKDTNHFLNVYICRIFQMILVIWCCGSSLA